MFPVGQRVVEATQVNRGKGITQGTQLQGICRTGQLHRAAPVAAEPHPGIQSIGAIFQGVGTAATQRHIRCRGIQLGGVQGHAISNFHGGGFLADQFYSGVCVQLERAALRVESQGGGGTRHEIAGYGAISSGGVHPPGGRILAGQQAYFVGIIVGSLAVHCPCGAAGGRVAFHHGVHIQGACKTTARLRAKVTGIAGGGKGGLARMSHAAEHVNLTTQHQCSVVDNLSL